MRHKILPLLSTLILAACSSSASLSSSYAEHNYSEVSDLIITYDQAFTISDNDHFIYFYSENCYHCKELKNEVIDFVLKGYTEFYFVVGSIDIPHNYTDEEINQTLGSSNIDDVYVGVVPQLVLIKDGKINKNIVKNVFIEEELSHYRN